MNKTWKSWENLFIDSTDITIHGQEGLCCAVEMKNTDIYVQIMIVYNNERHYCQCHIDWSSQK